MIVQTIIFRIGRYVISCIFGSSVFVLRSFLAKIIPVNYFVILYCVIYILSPYIGIVIDKLGKRNLKRMLITFILVFSVYPSIVDLLEIMAGREFRGLNSIGMYGDQNGYTVVNFMLCWILGAYIRKTKMKVSKGKCLGCYLILSVVSVLGVKFMMMLTGSRGNMYSYCNPIVILQAMSIFLFFSQINVGNIKWINSLAKEAFSVFLLHDIFLPHIGIERFATGNVAVMLIHIMCSAIGIYIICWGGGFIYDRITRPVWRKIEKRYTLPEIVSQQDELFIAG